MESYKNLPKESESFQGYSVIVQVTKLDGNVVTAYYDSYTENWNVIYSKETIPVDHIISWSYISE